ncbi:MAG TPA: hypothetical protein VJO99_10270 [Burkholderiaceae bacterium]|nr:hypothetical protein [Burkholderiaceae bacterium]
MVKTTMPSKPILSSRAASAAAPQRATTTPASPLRQFKVLQSGHAPAQLSLFLRPAGVR